VPPWYLNLRAARYMRIPVTEVEQMSVLYRSRALAAEKIEADEQAKAEKRAARRAKRPGVH